MPSNKKKPNGQQPPTVASNDRRIPFLEAVAKYQELEKNQCRDAMAQGELADKVEPIYGDRTLAKFAKAVGKSACTLARQRSVYRAWDGSGIQAPGPVSYAVLRELQTHPDREAIVKEKPKITKREAQEIMREHHGKRTKGKSGDGQHEEHKRWLRQLYSFANKHGGDAEEAMRNDEVMDALREVFVSIAPMLGPVKLPPEVNRDALVSTKLDVAVAMELAPYFNENEDGRAWPSCKTIGDAIHVHETSVLRSLRRLHARGHLRVVWGKQGKGRTGQYWMVLKTCSQASLKPAPKQVLKPASQFAKPAPMQEIPFNKPFKGKGGNPPNPPEPNSAEQKGTAPARCAAVPVTIDNATGKPVQPPPRRRPKPDWQKSYDEIADEMIEEHCNDQRYSRNR
jgi:hypothetical protein